MLALVSQGRERIHVSSGVSMEGREPVLALVSQGRERTHVSSGVSIQGREPVLALVSQGRERTSGTAVELTGSAMQ